jgi:hypothetical protein
MTQEFTLKLTSKQARLLSIAVQQEIVKGSSTFLSGRDVLDLGQILDQIHAQAITVAVGQQFIKETV